MNKGIQEFLHERAVSTRDGAKSRIKTVGEDAVEDVLRKIKEISE
jgi:hypothetical protein